MIEKVCPFHGIPTPEGKCMRKEFNEKKGEMEECRAIPKDSTTIYWCKEHRIPIFDRKCACCERDKNEGIRKPDVIDKIEYIGTDLRLVFPEEQLLLGNILDIDKPLEMIGKSVWYNGHSYIVDGEKVKIYNCNAEDKNSLSSTYINDIEEDVNGNIWIATDSGLDFLVTDSDTITRMKDMETDKYNLGNLKITSLLKSEQEEHIMWVGTEKGLIKVNVLNNTMEAFYHNENDSFYFEYTLLFYLICFLLHNIGLLLSLQESSYSL